MNMTYKLQEMGEYRFKKLWILAVDKHQFNSWHLLRYGHWGKQHMGGWNGSAI